MRTSRSQHFDLIRLESSEYQDRLEDRWYNYHRLIARVLLASRCRLTALACCHLSLVHSVSTFTDTRKRHSRCTPTFRMILQLSALHYLFAVANFCNYGAYHDEATTKGL